MYNPHDKKNDYINSMKAIDKMAIHAKKSPEVVALEVIKENLPTIQQYVLEHGQKPEADPVSLAAQAMILHEQKIWDKVENGGIPDYEAAEAQVLADEQAAEDAGSISNFDGSILGVVFKAGSSALDKINAKRKAQGKKPILDGEKGQKLRDKIGRHIELERIDSASLGKKTNSKWKETDGGIILDSLAKEIEREKTKQAVKKYLPFAIIAIVLIIIIARKTA